MAPVTFPDAGVLAKGRVAKIDWFDRRFGCWGCGITQKSYFKDKNKMFASIIHFLLRCNMPWLLNFSPCSP